MSTTHIWLLENGKRIPTLTVLFALAAVLRIRPEVMVTQTRYGLGKTNARGYYPPMSEPRRKPEGHKPIPFPEVVKRLLNTPPSSPVKRVRIKPAKRK